MHNKIIIHPKHIVLIIANKTNIMLSFTETELKYNYSSFHKVIALIRRLLSTNILHSLVTEV